MSLHVHRLGAEPAAASAPPVLLLHGFASSGGEDYDAGEWSRALERAGRTGYALDLPGHGESPAVSGEAAGTGALLAGILAAVEAELPAGAFDVIAYSLGARLAWELPGATPRVRRMVLGGISPREPFGAIDAAALREVLAGGEPADPLTGQIGAMIAAPGRDTESLIEVIRGLAAVPFDPREAAPRIPVLLVAGRDDVVAQGIEELAGLLPHGKLRRVPGDHRVALTGPELRDAALDFLGRD